MSAYEFCPGKKTDELCHRGFVEGGSIASDTPYVKYLQAFWVNFRVNECNRIHFLRIFFYHLERYGCAVINTNPSSTRFIML